MVALGQRFTKRVDVITSGVPGFVASVDCDALVNEPGADGVFGFVNPLVKCLAIFDERAEFPVFMRRSVDGFEFSHGSHASEFEGVVTIGSAFDVGPPPSFLVGATDECFQSVTLSQVIDPARRATSFHDDEVSFRILEDTGDGFPVGGRGEELGFSGFGVEEAGNGVEFAEVQCENLHC
ncbi:hypothetical protein Pla52o_57290 [Novipirellula galeiformis]|uniref:Uncharacterized protein n=1 Tax=Novipirellula galeiformis TaxID=2528004 RepID=A0A5C6BDS0_9BACT|nr:hypothetical protein Pla52o_57290 [Novipirellula galeiformis]